MAKKRFTFADAKERIKELEASLEDALLNQDDNIYDKGEQKWIKFYQYGFIVSVLLNIWLILM